MLCLLEGELDQGVFSTLMSQFITYWSAKEPDFVKLFEKSYAHRPGKILHLFRPYTRSTCTLPSFFTEEWAKSYRLFEHGDTDTNMFLER